MRTPNGGGKESKNILVIILVKRTFILYISSRRKKMPQISLYVDETTLKKVEYAAARQHKSLSKWVIDQIKPKIDPIYPTDFEKLFGSINDSTFTRSEELSFNNDVRRETL
jgi:hypothetical protein